MNARFFLRKTPTKRRHKKREKNRIFQPARKPEPIQLPPRTLSRIQFKNLHEKIKALSEVENLASGEKLTPEEIGRILGVHSVEVREILKKIRIEAIEISKKIRLGQK